MAWPSNASCSRPAPASSSCASPRVRAAGRPQASAVPRQAMATTRGPRWRTGWSCVARRASRSGWGCDPSSPLGQADRQSASAAGRARWCSTAPTSRCAWTAAGDERRQLLARFWQLWTPNKALGLTGVRAPTPSRRPAAHEAGADSCEALAPSWPIGAHGVAMLQAWCRAGGAAMAAQSLHTLREWKRRSSRCANRWVGTACPATPISSCARIASARGLLERCAQRGIKLRDAPPSACRATCA